MNPKRRRLLLSLPAAFVLCVCIIGLVALEKGVAKEGLSGATAYYIVREGDTLWDITNRFYEDPYLWPVVWGYNNHIANPHWIYPGDPIYLASIAGRYLSDAAVESEEPVVAPPIPSAVLPDVSTMFISRRIADTALLTADTVAGAGRVLASRDGKVLLSQEDEVFLQLPETADASHEGPYQVLRGLREIRHPETKERMGTLYSILGYVEAVGRPQEGVSRGIVLTSQDAIEPGDLLRRAAPPPGEILSNPSKRNLEGFVVAGLRSDELLSEYDVVFIDKGVEEGVAVGDTFWILEPAREVRNPSGTGTITLPDTRMAVVVIIHAEQQTATALVTNSQCAFSAGHRIRARTE